MGVGVSQHNIVASLSLAILLLPAIVAGQQPAVQQLDFLGVAPPNDDDYRRADSALRDFLNREIGRSHPGFALNYRKFDNYGEEIREVTERGNRPYLARMTPYSYVTAWMLGADFDVLATYESVATGSTIYRSYFVVNSERFGNGPANLDTLREFLKHGAARPKFVYHDQFSTSSYFLPALWLRRQLIFDMPASSGALTAIEARFNGAGSSDSVRAVAGGDADLAAVWDGTRKKLQGSPELTKVTFIPLPDPLPNDLLVSSNRLDVETKKAVIDAVAGMKAKGSGPGAFASFGDFKSWVKIQDAPDARQALANLRQLATAPPAPVVVALHAPEAFQVALRKALRLSYPEYILYDPDFHETWDVDWKLEEIHDGAVELTIDMHDSNVATFSQRFPISYVSVEGDLTTRIIELIHTRMHRVRYIWPYQDQAPTILGDVDFTLEPGSQVRVERITWLDPQRNDFTRSNLLQSTVENSDFYKLRLRRDDFQAVAGGKFDFNNPLGNVAYRALLVRPSYESTATKVVTAALVVLLLGAAVGAGFDLRRKSTAPPPPATQPTLAQECLALARATHAPWRRTLNDADKLWCDRRDLEEKIAELKTQGLIPFSLGGKVRVSSKWTVGSGISVLKGLLTVRGEGEVYRDLVVDPRDVGDTVRLSALLGVLIDKGLLSTFVGRPVEWDGLNRLVARAIGAQGPSDTTALKPSDEAIVGLASHHFGSVIEDGLTNWSLFRATWTLSSRGDQTVATAVVPLAGELEVGREKERVQALRMEFDVPAKTESWAASAGAPPCTCWLMGNMLKVSAVHEGGVTSLLLRFGAIALLGDIDPSSFELRS